jgi:hypothetical protein
MTNQIPYTPEELTGKFICCFPVTIGRKHFLDCVRHYEGPHDNEPYLYNSIEQAKADMYFDRDIDEVIPAQEYFNRINSVKIKV